MIDLSSLELRRYYLITSVQPTDSFEVSFILKHLRYHSVKSFEIYIEGFIDGQREDINLENMVGFHLLDVLRYPDRRFCRERYLIHSSSIKTIRPLEKRDGPLILNWSHLFTDVKTFLFG